MLSDEEIIAFVQPYTMVSRERLENALHLVQRVVEEQISGDFVEIGVWRGGVVMAICLKLKQLGVQNRHVYGYDTFEGMTAPTNDDKTFRDELAEQLLSTSPSIKCYSSYDETKQNTDMVQYPHIHLRKGDICKTPVRDIPNKIALLRLDTDWYESTKFELDFFEPRVTSNGFIIIDDYGHWKGCKKAVDLFLEQNPNIIMQTIDYTGRWWQKKLLTKVLL